MPLSAGTRLGSYEIRSALGAGGMGEVYRARDTQLDRDVAIKIVPEAFAADAERVARFQREAKVLASLNHPHIAAIYGLENADGITALVMELVEGEDLSQRLARGGIPLDEALPIAKQIAEALEAAHQQGIIHRDLKPANIKVRSDGQVKVLDFGLAKAMEPTAGSPPSVSMSPTITTPAMTHVGILLGTAAYMSPEQAKGRSADKRADIWAFGVVIHELLTGRPLFKGDDIGETLAAVIKETPSWDGIPETLLPLLQACLEKDPAKRLRDIGDAWRLVELGATKAEPVAPGPLPSKPGGAWLAWVTAAALATGLAAVSWRHFRETPASLPEVRFEISSPAAPSGNPDNRWFGFRLSPDGRTLAIVSAHQGSRKLYARRLDSLDVREVPGTDGCQDIFWAPDSTAIGFFAGGKLKRVALDGRPPRELADAPNPRGGAWNRNGVILFSASPLEPLKRVGVDGGTAMSVSQVGDIEGDRYPEFLPDQNHFLYMHGTDDKATEGVYVASLDGQTAPRRLLEEPGNVAFVPGDGTTGHLLYRSHGALVARGFDTKSLALVGGLKPVAESVRDGFNNIFWSSFSADAGGLAYWSGARLPLFDLVRVEPTGKHTPIAGVLGTPQELVTTPSLGAMALSPDGKRLTFFRNGVEPDPDLWVIDLPTERTYRAAESVTSAAWSPDGQELAFTSRTSVLTSVFRVRADGGSTPERLGPLGLNGLVYAWTPDGKWLVVGLRQSEDIGLFSMEAGHAVSDYVKTPAREGVATLSPDGKWVAYVSGDAGSQGAQMPEVFVRSMPLTSARYPLGRGFKPKWSRDGKLLYFIRQGAQPKLMAVPIDTTRGFDAGTAREVLDAAGIADFEPAPDGRFIAAIPRPPEAAAPITVVLNWKP